jgi:hypothetical protein
MKRLIPCVPLLLLTLCSCAGLTVSSVIDEDKERGIRYYESSPYLLVHTDNEGGLVTRLIYLPDPTKKMAVRPYARWASSSTTLNFKNGVLSSAETSFDETAVPKAILGAIEKAATAAIMAADEPQSETHNVPAPYLFKIVFECDKIVLKGGQALGPDGKETSIQVTVPKEKKP